MHYTKVTVRLTPHNEDAASILQAQMGELGFESFADNTQGFEGYIQRQNMSPGLLDGLDPMVRGVKVAYTVEDAPDEDWNREWEKNFFQPIVVDGLCAIRGTFHEAIPDVRHEIIINPQMAFGTGHHETTRLMLSYLLRNDVEGLDILDMGCGTGVLGILAIKLKAKSVLGIDIDEWSVGNAQDNIKLNGISTGIEVQRGTAESLRQRKNQFDLVLANINRNILIADMPLYSQSLRKGGKLVLSGFYDIDAATLKHEAQQLRLECTGQHALNDWTELEFVKQ